MNENSYRKTTPHIFTMKTSISSLPHNGLHQPGVHYLRNGHTGVSSVASLHTHANPLFSNNLIGMR